MAKRKKRDGEILVNFQDGGPLDGGQRTYPRDRLRLDQTLVLPFRAQCGLKHVYESLGPLGDPDATVVDVYYRGICDEA